MAITFPGKLKQNIRNQGSRKVKICIY